VTTTIVLEPPCVFLNANDSLHFQAKGKRVKKWRETAQAAVNALFEPHRYERAHVVCAIRFPDNKRRDVGNWYPTAKAIVDGLVDANLLPDDNDRHLTGPDMRREYPNGPARVTVTITPLEQP
jgi:crossover junction endodeoxyribonuclease RusA